MDLFSNLWLGLQVAAEPVTLAYCFFGVLLGTVVGVLPGIGSLAAISLLLPLTYHMPPTAAIIMLAGVYYGAQYGGSTASILLNLPGSPSSAVTCLDGYPMAKKGKAGVALFVTTIASRCLIGIEHVTIDFCVVWIMTSSGAMRTARFAISLRRGPLIAIHS